MTVTGLLRAAGAVTFALLSLARPVHAQGNYTLFESGPVRPLALSPDGSKLFVCNIPDGRLEIFDVTSAGLSPAGSVQVGVDPVAVAARTNGEVWVVNHQSDSVSIVDVASLRVARTLLVGDEPRDIVFAGPGRNRAFITAAHRGQNRPGDPELLTPGVPRADVWVFDATNLGATFGGDEIAILSLFGDTPRALAVSPNGATVYAAVFHSGNQTTAVTEGNLPTPAPLPTVSGLPAPQVGVMLKQVGPTTWRDVTGTDHNNLVRFSLPDHDVFAINANAAVLDATAVTAEIDHVGTVLFNMVVHPTNGTVYVTNTEANNMDRFEGSGATTLRGELHRAQISLINGGVVQPRRLNPHITYTDLSPPASVNDRSLAIPTDLAISSDGSTLYVAAFGSQKIGIVSTAALALAPGAPGAYTPNTADHVALSGGGPGGVVLDEANGRLYVLTRFDNAVSVVDTAARLEEAHLSLHTPEPASIVAGRRFLYDSRFSSSNGEASCASCHVFGDFDSLSWDLGDPDGARAQNNNPFVKITNTSFAIAGPTLNLLAPGSVVPGNLDFHPLKGPMNTQTLRGMQHGGPMHWRGDRSGGTAQNHPFYDGTPSALDETLAFQAFNPAFVGLLGRQTTIPPADMAAFTNFILQVQLPPNPIRSLDRALTAAQQAGATFFGNPTTPGPISDTLKDCNGCHTLNAALGFFGSGGLSTFESETQHFKVAHLRNAYQKVGMFGTAGTGGGNPTAPQVRGFGYLHDGSVDTVVTFLGAASVGSVFQFPGGDPQRRQVADFVMAFDSDLAPVVGQQVTLSSVNASDSALIARLNLLVARAGTAYADADRPVNNECDLVVKGRIAGQPRGWWMSAPGVFTPDLNGGANLSDASLRALASTSGQELTYTCVPPGSGERVGIDRGGIGDASQPDGLRDASQCGDVTADGVDTASDVASLRAWLAGASTPAVLTKCNVRGASGSSATACDIVDVAALRRAVQGLAPALTQGCTL